jgi:putative SOS response-associated peptidase YedK
VGQATQRIEAGNFQRPRRNSRRETVLQGAVQDQALPHARVRLFEWKDTPQGKQPHYFTARDGSPVLTIAALWDEWTDRANSAQPLRSCTMIITTANDFVAEVHDRMPALLKPEQFDDWLSGVMTAEDLRPADNDYLQRWPVSKRVNSSKADDNDVSLIEAKSSAPADQLPLT